MRIGLDYDGTYTADPAFWKAFIALAKQHGHSVHVVTCRRNTPESRTDVDPPAPVWFTDMASKRWHMEQAGVSIDVWIDDEPETVVNGK